MLRILAQIVTIITRVIVENTSKIAADTATGARNNIENGFSSPPAKYNRAAS
jgi:hypothetical protein